MKKGNTTIFLTTKKGEEKGQKDIYMVNQDGDIVEGAKGIIGIYFNSDIPIGISAKNPKTGVLLMNQESIIVDPFHPVQILDDSELAETDLMALNVLKKDMSELLNDASSGEENADMPLGSLEDVLDTLKDLGKDVKIKAKGALGSFESLQDVINELRGTTKSSQTTATDAMNEIAEMFKSGKIDDKRFRELIPQGSFLEFSKKLSEETKDPSYYNIAKVLESLNPSR